MFGDIAPRYDLLNRLLSLGQDGRWRRRAVGLFGPELRCVLDVAAGTGDLALAWLDRRPGGLVLAADFAPEMAAVGRAKLSGRAGYLGYVLGDALALPIADGAFDGCMAAFGVRNFADLEAGLAEMARVLRPGGELVVLEFFPSRSPLVEGIFRLYFRHLLPRLGRRVSGHPEAYRYLPRSVEGFATREAFAALLARLGFHSIRRRELSGGIATAFHAVRARPPVV
jgi:demethylmenaquinone methyltransferase/2-methoxy-6-polyprenyl-1,4-benzoquinol methylase